MGACLSSDTSRRHKQIEDQMNRQNRTDRGAKKMLLLGSGSSGKSTLFKQLKCIHGYGFDESEYKESCHVIRSNCVVGCLTLLKKSQELYDKNTQLNADCHVDLENPDVVKSIEVVVDWFNRVGQSVFEMPDNLDWKQVEILGASVDFLWNLPQLKETFSRRDQFSLPDNMDHFLNKVNDIMKEDYKPDDIDTLKVRIRTTGVVSETYDMKDTTFHIYDVGGQRNERKKWIHSFQSVTALIFVAALNHYASVLFEDEQKNAMHESIELFGEIINSKWFRSTETILFLNKDDLFQERLAEEIPLSVCFSEQAGWEGDVWNGPDYEEKANKAEDTQVFQDCYEAARDFVSKMYLAQSDNPHKRIFVHFTTATDRDNVEKVFWDVQNIVIRGNMKKGGLV